PVVEPPVLHHVADRVRVLDVIERVGVQDLEVRELARLERAQLLAQTNAVRAELRPDANHVDRLDTACRERPQLPVHAESLHLAVPTKSDAPAGIEDLLHLLCHLPKDILIVTEPLRSPKRALVD